MAEKNYEVEPGAGLFIVRSGTVERDVPVGKKIDIALVNFSMKRMCFLTRR